MNKTPQEFTKYGKRLERGKKNLFLIQELPPEEAN